MSLARALRLTALAIVVGACNHSSVPARRQGQAQAATPGVAAEGVHRSLPFLQLTGTQGSVADVVEQVLPSVVAISTKRQATGARPFFHPFLGPGLQFAPPRPEQGLGSGVVISDGVIVTNNHVVEGASEIKVVTSDKREYPAQKVGADPQSDLAVLRVKGSLAGLRPIQLGSSAALRLGDVVLAVGHPFGIGETVTSGIVSAKGRSNLGIAAYEDFIQTDAAINPGNSGGALVDTRGKLVGINTAILSRSGGNVGVGFAIPIDMARPIIDALLRDGRVVRGWLGIGIQDVTPDLAAALHLPAVSGVIVTQVQPGTPAAKAGLQTRDVVLTLDGRTLGSSGELRNLVAAAGAGHRATLVLHRDGTQRTVLVDLGALSSDRARPPAPGSDGPAGSPTDAIGGLRLAPLDTARRRGFDPPDGVDSGLVVIGVVTGTPAATTGLRPGDVILEINRQRVVSVDQFERQWSRAADSVLLLVRRDDLTEFVVLQKR